MDWILINDGLPVHGQLVLIYSHSVSPAEYDGRRNMFERYPNHVDGDRVTLYHFTDVTHWMPLPEPPKT